MKTTLLSSLILMGTCLFGQISIDSNDMPVVGDTLRYSIAMPDPTFMSSYQNTGANYTWNFSYLQPMAQEIEKFVPSSQTSYSFQNTIAKLYADTLNMGGMEFTDIYEFRKMDSSSVQMVGRGISYLYMGIPFPVSIPYTDSGMVYQFPLSYNDRDSNYFVAEYNQVFLGVFYQAKGYRINSVDGYGQITTPYGTFTAIRVVTDIVESDTIHYDTTNFRIDTHFREYKWLAKGIKYPVLQVAGTVFAGNFIPSMVSYRDSVRNLIVGLEESGSMETTNSIFPNPNTGEAFKLNLNESVDGPFSVDLLDVSGKLIHAYQRNASVPNSSAQPFHLPTDLQNGLYFIRIKSRNFTQMEKFIIHKK